MPHPLLQLPPRTPSAFDEAATVKLKKTTLELTRTMHPVVVEVRRTLVKTILAVVEILPLIKRQMTRATLLLVCLYPIAPWTKYSMYNLLL